MKTPDPRPDWAAEDLSEQGQEDLRRLVEFGEGPFDVEGGLSAFEERIAKVQSARAAVSRTLLLGALALTGLAAATGFAVFGAGAPAPPPSPSSTRAPTPPPTPPAETETSAEATPATSIPSVSVDALPTVASAHTRPIPVPSVKSAAALSVVPVDPGDLVDAEVQHASKLRIVARTDPRSALSLAAEGDQLFPNGLLHAEREAIAIEALARLDRSSEARARADAFATAFPTHPRTGRIRAISKGERPWEP